MKQTLRSIRLVRPFDPRAPKQRHVEPADQPSVTVRYVGQELGFGVTSVLSERSIAIATTKSSYKRGSVGSHEHHPYLALARVDDKRLVRGAALPVGGHDAVVGDCAIVASNAENGEHFAWVFNVVSGELARVALPAKVTSISGAGDWLALGYEDGAASVVSTADWGTTPTGAPAVTPCARSRSIRRATSPPRAPASSRVVA